VILPRLPACFIAIDPIGFFAVTVKNPHDD